MKSGSNGRYPGTNSRSTKVSKNHVVCARCHLAGLASGHDCTIMSSGVRVAQSVRLRLLTLQYSSASTAGVSTLMDPSSVSFPPEERIGTGGGCPSEYHLAPFDRNKMPQF